MSRRENNGSGWVMDMRDVARLKSRRFGGVILLPENVSELSFKLGLDDYCDDTGLKMPEKTCMGRSGSFENASDFHPSTSLECRHPCSEGVQGINWLFFWSIRG